MTIRRVLLTLAIMAALVGAPAAQAEPLTIRQEDVEVVTVNGSIDIGNGEYISYRITATKRTGQYLASSTKTPGTTYKSSSACIVFSASFFSDTGCGKATSLDVADNLSSGKGAFTAKMRQFGVKVNVAFSVKGKGTITETQRPVHSLSQQTMSASVSAGRWLDRYGKPSGSFSWPGYPKAPISGGGGLSKGTVVLVNLDA